MPQQTDNQGWEKVDAVPPGWTRVGNLETNNITGITVPKGSVTADDPSSVFGGFLNRGKDIVKGIYHTVTDPPTAEESKEFPSAFERPALVEHRLAKGAYEGEKQAVGQIKEQLKTAAKTQGDPIAKGLQYARAGVTAASMADPFATGSVTDINRMEDEGRNREAIGSGAFDALTLLVGGKTGREVSPETRMNKLAYATGAKSIRPLEHILPDIESTVSRVGKPQTVGQLQNVIQTTMDGYEQTFNRGLATTKGQIIPSDIADALESKAKSLPPTREGQAIANKLKKAAVEYRKPWTPQELNSERMYRNANTQAFNAKSGVQQMAAMRANADTMIDEIVAEKSRDVLYDEMERQHPGQGFRELKRKQSSVLDMMDGLKDHVEKLEASQAKRAGAPFSEKAGISTSVHAGGATPRMHVTELLRKGPLTYANAATQKAFGPTSAATARRAAILSLPVAAITSKRPVTVPAPPSSDEN